MGQTSTDSGDVIGQLIQDDESVALLTQRDSGDEPWTRERLIKEIKIVKYDLNGDGAAD